ncbi:MAG: peptide ABC transporter substrate-binding protein [Candidatus Eremiobacteraeota bacterium]|nr:peptide ABC transporter substrate-binding protein [Candidatus Eremiobacteraeota bacterium]MBC5803519.1 peptide ABC transporter substrate-binding protein [Candidatus Eremiobacteraeota bacterium]MBC5821442.1 peptide ABC transporter substrate-binding protein [Candidatus Eremiobacteraeota bacterium]
MQPRICGLFISLALGGALAGCGGRSQSAGGVVIRFDVPADPANLNPLFAHADAGNVEQQLAHLAFEPFFDIDAHGRQVPELLSEIPTLRNGGISRDGRTLVYHLRRSLRWSDGVPLTARDVLFTLAAIRDPRNPVGSRAGYELIDRADAPTPRTVRFHLSRPWAPAVATFFTYGTSPQYVLPEHVLSKERPLERAPFNAAPIVGDGPFRFVSWTRGDRLRYVANSRYWRGVPPVPRLDIRVVPDPETNLTLLRSGQIDFNLIAPAQQATLQRSSANVRYAYAATALIAGIALQTARPPLDDARVRRALAASIDRDGISRKIAFGRYPVADSDRPRFSWAYDPSVREPSFDPAAADRAFDAAGWRRGADGIRRKAGQRLALTYVQFPETATGVRSAAVVQRELYERGVAVTIKSISNAQLFLPAADGGTLATGNFDLAYVPWSMGADPDDRFLLGCERAVANYMRYCNANVQKLEDAAVIRQARDARKVDYRAIDNIIARDVPIIYLFNPTYIYAYRPRLTGFAPNAFVPTWNAYAWRVGGGG